MWLGGVAVTGFHPGVGTIWSDRDLAQARRMRAGALSFHEIGRALNRSADAVCAALADERVQLGRTVYPANPYDHLIGSPRVVVVRHASGASVTLQQAPWGMSRTRLDFLSPGDPGIDWFAQELLTRVRLLGERELERLEKRQRVKDEARRRRGR